MTKSNKYLPKITIIAKIKAIKTYYILIHNKYMEETIKKILYFIGLPTVITILLLGLLNELFNDLEKSINATSTLVQTMAIFIGGLWAYHKFGWEKKAESAIKIKAMLMEYEQIHNEAAAQYRIDESNNENWLKCWSDYAMRMIPPRNKFASQIHLSCYLPKKTRDRLFKVVWLSVNKGKGLKDENLNENWKKFGIELEQIKKELDDIVSK